MVNHEATGIGPASAAFAWPTLNIDRAALIACVTRCRAAGVTYGLGAKAETSKQAPGAAANGFRHIDCSGFVGWALAQSTNDLFTRLLDRGSVEQHDWIDAQGFKRSSSPACHLIDGAVRIAFLSPVAGGGIGHVMLVLDGKTIESHGGVGPDRRVWDTVAHPFMAECAVFVLMPPSGSEI